MESASAVNEAAMVAHEQESFESLASLRTCHANPDNKKRVPEQAGYGDDDDCNTVLT